MKMRFLFIPQYFCNIRNISFVANLNFVIVVLGLAGGGLAGEQ